MEFRRVLLSLNTLDEEGKLLCRTLFEKDLDEILLKNNHACGIVLEAMKVKSLTTKSYRIQLKENPFSVFLKMNGGIL